MLTVAILRGVPGSGKSSYARKIQSSPHKVTIVSADDYFLDSFGKYTFRPEDIGKAHDQCLLLYIECLEFWSRRCEQTDATLFVDNTNIHSWEVSPYYRLAEITCHTQVKIINFPCDPFIACARNVHAVPLAVVQKMAEDMKTEKLPPWWVQETIAA